MHADEAAGRVKFKGILENLFIQRSEQDRMSNYDTHLLRCNITTTHVSFSRSVVSPVMHTLHNSKRSSEWTATCDAA